MSRRKSFRVATGVLALLSGIAVSGKVETANAAGSPDDVRLIRPNVMVLLDTSGSMEWRTGVANDTCIGSDGGACNRCSNSTAAAPVGICSPACPAAERKNRWATALEVLTGSIQNFTCQENVRTNNAVYDYDYLYTVPYHEPLSNGVPLYDPTAPPQLPDGVLDTYADRVRFGLMTFDNDYCVGLSAGFGMYSFGPDRTFTAPGCNVPVQVNVGIRREATGAGDPVNGGLVSVGNPNANADELSLLNVNVQQVLTGNAAYGPVAARRGVRPFGGTPIAAMLDDARYYWTHHPDVVDGSDGSGIGDPYYRCRGRFNILVTDGKPNMDFRNVCSGSQCPYETPDLVTADMANPGRGTISTFVVAFNASDSGAATALGDIARQGDPNNMIGGVPLFASDRNELQANISRILDGIAAGTSTRTQPSVGMTAAGTAGATLYQFNSAFTVAGGFPWRGVLERRRTTCVGTSPAAQTYDPAQRDDFGALMTRTARVSPPGTAPAEWADGSWGERRNLWTWGRPTGIGSAPGEMQGNLQAPATPVFPANSDMIQNLNPVLFAVPTPATSQAVTVQRVRDWMYGGGYVPASDPASAQLRNTYPLGDIYHSNPQLVTPPGTSLADQSYAAFRQIQLSAGVGWRRTKTMRATPVTIGTRESVVYAGSNDGVLHAFNVHTGEEIWGFVPPYLVPTLRFQYPANHQYGVDGTPVVRDVIYQRTATSLGVGTDWHTQLVVGLRGGGPVYNSLDVTDPYVPKFLWQFNTSNSLERTEAPATAAAMMPFTRNSYGNPAIATAYMRWAPNGASAPMEPVERSIVIIPGGEGRPVEPCGSSSNPVRPRLPNTLENASSGPGRLRTSIKCWEGTLGQWVFIVDAQTGQLIRRMGFNGSRSIPTGSPIVGTPSMYIGTEGAVATRGYIGDADGRVWRIDITNPDPDQWNFVPMVDLFSGQRFDAGQPIVSPVSVSVDADGSTLIAAGTGNPDLLEGSESNRIAVYRETATLSSGIVSRVEFKNVWELKPTNPPSTAIDRQKYLYPGERLTGPFSLFNGVLYFGTFVPATGNDRCEFGFSRLWGVDLTATDSVDTSLPMPRFDADGDEATNDLVRVTSNLDGAGAVDDIDRNSVLFGVGVVREPVCVNVSTVSDPFQGGTRSAIDQAGGGSFSLIAQTGRSSVMPGVSRTTVVRRRLPSPVIDIRLDAWASVFE